MTPVDTAFLVLFIASFVVFMVTLAAASWYVEHDAETPGEKAAHIPAHHPPTHAVRHA